MKRSPLKQGKPLKRTAMRRGGKRTKYARRERDFAFMGFVKTLRCAAKTYSMPWLVDHDTACGGGIEADHMGHRAVGRKADDGTCGPLCSSHHRERTDHSGMFKHATRDQLRAWRIAVVDRTQELFRSRPE